MKWHPGVLAWALVCAALALPDPAGAGRRRPAVHEAAGFQSFTSPQASPIARQHCWRCTQLNSMPKA